MEVNTKAFPKGRPTTTPAISCSNRQTYLYARDRCPPQLQLETPTRTCNSNSNSKLFLPRAMTTHLSGFYLHVVADVINNVREDFLNEGFEESVLREIQSVWERNMMRSGIIQASHGDILNARRVGGGHPTTTSVHDLNVPYEGETQTPTAELLFSPTPMHTPLPTFVTSGPGSEHPDTFNATDIAIGTPAAYMPSPWVNQKPDINLGMNPKLDMNIAYEEEEPANGHPLVTKEFLPTSIGKRKREDNFPSGSYFPQQDGAGDYMTMSLSLEQSLCGDELHKPSLKEAPTALYAKKKKGTCIDCCKVEERKSTVVDSPHTTMHTLFPQLDGIADHYDDGVAEEDYNEPDEEVLLEQLAAESAELKPDGGASDGSEPPLNEDDDLEDLDGIAEGEERFQTGDVVHAQFEKVHRSKSRWKCSLKDGIMRLNNRDFVFSRANGEFEFC